MTRLALALLLAGCAASATGASPRPSVSGPPARPAAVEAVAFEPHAEALTVRVRTTAHVASFSVEQQGRTVRLVLVGADVAPALERGRTAPPVRDYRVEAAGDRVVLTFDAPGTAAPHAARDTDSPDVLLTFTAPRADVAAQPTTRRAGGWGRPREPETPRAETPRAESPRAEALPSVPAETPRHGADAPRLDPVAAPDVAARRTPARRTRRAAVPARPEPIRPEPARAPAPTETPVPVGPAPVPAAPDPTPEGAAPTASAWQTAPPVVVPYTPEASAVYVANGNNWRLDTIVLDAGHGGHDIGATYNGVREKDVTLGITLALGRMIEQELGLRVVYTRRDDHFEELRERGRIANRSGGKLFVSIHANAAPTAPSASGTETYFLAPHRSASAQEVMERENSVIQLETAPDLYAEYTDQGDILQAMTMSAYQEESQTIARLVETRLTGQGRRSRGVKQAGFLVLWAASMPAILVETGFVSNAAEARLLGSREGQEQTARAIFEAVAAYRDHYERGLVAAAAQP